MFQAKLVHDLRYQINNLQNKLSNVQNPSVVSVNNSGEKVCYLIFKLC